MGTVYRGDFEIRKIEAFAKHIDANDSVKFIALQLRDDTFYMTEAVLPVNEC